MQSLTKSVVRRPPVMLYNCWIISATRSLLVLHVMFRMRMGYYIGPVVYHLHVRAGICAVPTDDAVATDGVKSYTFIA